jgi:hypothetical protein
MRAPVAFAAAALAVPLIAAADFEGVLESKMSGQVNGTGRTWISKEGIKMEMEMQVPSAEQADLGKTFSAVTIVKAAEPNTTYFLNEKRKTYSIHEHKPGQHVDDTSYTVKRLGKDTVAGYSCEKVTVTSSHDSVSEMCVSSELVAGESWLRAFQARGQDRGQGLQKALLDAGVKGLPIRWSSRGKAPGEVFTMELVSARRQSVPASTFAIPKGYTKAEFAMPAMSPEMEKKMEEAHKRQAEALKNLSPEQRKQMEEMMKRYGAQGAQQ